MNMASIKDSKVLRYSALVLAVSMAVTACNDDDEKSITFEGVSAPSTDSEKRAILASSKVNVNGKNYDIGYHTIMRSGDQPSSESEQFGQMYDMYNNKITLGGEDWVSNSNDFASLLTGTDGKLYMVSHFENSPAAMYVTELSQDADTGVLSAVRTRHIDYSHFGGGWVHCAGSVTPWGTHLGSEEYEPDASAVDSVTSHFNDYYGMTQALYYGLDTDNAAAGYYSSMNIYNYGWQIEVTVNDYNDVETVKHYTMGRVAHELAYVMPDRKTAYISDDGTNVGLYMFKADNEGDLSSGELFVAKWHQTSSDNGGAADLTWINLGHATDAEIKNYLDQKVAFSDIFDEVDPEEDGSCASGYTSVNTTTGHECLSVKSGMETAASRMETRRYAAMLGGTTEFRKMEGITFNPDDNVMYLAISEVARGMEDFMKSGSASDSYDLGGYNDITLSYNECGTVFALDVNDEYTAQNMKALVSGTMIDDDENNTCHLDGIANPDNITYMPGYKTLIIGEDTGSGHQNDVIWSYNIESDELTRIQTTPYGSETTSPYFYPNINGWAYLMSVIQHPYGESDEDKSTGSTVERAYTGYMGPFPAMD